MALSVVSIALLLLLPLLLYNLRRSTPRTTLLHPTAERVLILGGSSGIGRQIALLYARRGAKVCVVARRQAELEEVRKECEREGEGEVRIVSADFGVVEEMVGVRKVVQDEMGGIDTLVVCAGVSALKPIMGIAGVQDVKEDATVEGLHAAVAAGNKVASVNYIGPLLAAVTFIPMLTRASPSPSVLLISSAAALIPAPTRALYCSSKSASLSLYQSLAIEHPRIAFTYLLPGTVKTGFRAGAADGGPVLENLSKALGPEEVARRGVEGLDRGEGLVWIPRKYAWGHVLYYLGLRGIIEAQARKKYAFH